VRKERGERRGKGDGGRREKREKRRKRDRCMKSFILLFTQCGAFFSSLSQLAMVPGPAFLLL
jgi:hypothetical protein